MVGHKKHHNTLAMVDNKDREAMVKQEKVEEQRKYNIKKERLKKLKVNAKVDEEEKQKNEQEEKRKEEKKQKAEEKARKKKARKDQEKRETKAKEEEAKEKEARKKQEEKVRNAKEEEVKEKAREEEAKEKDKKAENIHPRFFKVILPGQSKEQLRIPLAFNKYLENESPGVISLKGPSGNTWRVDLVLNSKEFCFEHGWKDFVFDHHIKFGDFLVFCYDGRSQFSVLIFDPTACEKQSAFLAGPCNDVVVEDDDAADISQDSEGGMGSDAANISQGNKGDIGSNATDSSSDYEEDIDSDAENTSQDDDGDIGMDAADTSEEDEGNMGIYASDTPQHDEGDIRVDADKTSQDDEVEMYIGAADTTKTWMLQETTGARRKRTRKVVDLMANDYPVKKLSSSSAKAEDRRSEAASGPSKEAASRSLNNLKDSSSSMLVRSNESSSSNKSVRYLNKYVPRVGKAVAKVQKKPPVISQRRSITEQDKVNAVERAILFKSKRPFTQQIMKNCHAYTSFFLVLPNEFVQKYLPKSCMKMTLWDPQGKKWAVSYVYFSGRSSGAFSDGWGKLAVENNLEKFDVCVFELLDENNIKVHIYRAVLEITPCILSSDNK